MRVKCLASEDNRLLNEMKRHFDLGIIFNFFLFFILNF